MESCGLTADVFPTARHPIVFGRRVLDPSLPTMMFYGHYDVVPSGDIALWNEEPFSGVIKDGRMYGRGTADSKGQSVAILLGIKAAVDVAGDSTSNVAVLLDGEEEIGSPNLSDFLRANSAIVAADCVYIGDGPSHSSGRPLLALGCRGLLVTQLTAVDRRPDLHSGHYGGVAHNPVWRLMDALKRLTASDRRVPAAELTREVREVTVTIGEMLDAMPYPEDQAPYAAGLTDHDVKSRLSIEPAINVSGLAAGYVGRGFKTSIPSSASARVDIRLVPDQTPKGVFQAMVDMLDAAGLDVSVDLIAASPPAATKPDDPWVGRVAAILRDVYDAVPVVVPSLGGTVPMWAFTEGLGIPTVIVPQAGADQRNHAPNENYDLGYLPRGALTAARLVSG